ncbi:MAG: T9SS type A sorting domain-containing protein [Bacteroidales bacterium]|nr:T9SS type A sorting domain-containing protein [Bacteroidales bacterium]
MKRICLYFALFVGVLFPKLNCAQSLNWIEYADSFNERVFFAYAIQQSDDFELTWDEASRLVVRPHCNDESNVVAFLREKHAEFQTYSCLEKLEFGELFAQWRETLQEDVYKALVKQENLRAVTQNNFCELSEPFCTDNGMYEFPAGVNAGSGELGPTYDCLRTTPNPAWYYMRILDPGDMDIYMYSTPLVDIDFCCWGPFFDPLEPCPDGLTLSKVVSCSYLPAPTETCKIRGAQRGEYYILLITNFSNQICNINFSKVAGQATTDCSILAPLVDCGWPVCVGDDLVLQAFGNSDSEYHWFMVGSDWSSNEQNPIRRNATVDMSGTYGCAISRAGEQSDTAYLDVTVGMSYTYRLDTVVCGTFFWLGSEQTEGGMFVENLVSVTGCDSIIEKKIDMNFVPNFEIHGTHWPIGGSETHISVNEYEIELEDDRASIDTVLWQIDCPNWHVEPHGSKGEQGTLYIHSYLLEPVTLHAWAINRCDTVHEEFFIQTSYYGVDENAAGQGFEVFPNPTSGEIMLLLDSMEGWVEFEVFDAFGQRIDKFNVDADLNHQKTYNLHPLPDGVYLFVGKNKGEVRIRKVVLIGK